MRTCNVEECERVHYGKGFCTMHYLRWRKHGDPSFSKYERNHGQSETPEYRVWGCMKTRCYNKKTRSYKHYGGRGITVCKRWLHSFKAFYQDMGPKPFKKAQIDRINNDGNYEPSNCRWVTITENRRNRPYKRETAKAEDGA